jgi:hypothetical protein
MTALLTVLRYGEQKKVTVHFKDGKPAESIYFSAFKTKYTINPAEAKRLEESNEPAFPDVDYLEARLPNGSRASNGQSRVQEVGFLKSRVSFIF